MLLKIPLTPDIVQSKVAVIVPELIVLADKYTISNIVPCACSNFILKVICYNITTDCFCVSFNASMSTVLCIM